MQVAVWALIASKITVGVDTIAMRGARGISFGGARGLVSSKLTPGFQYVYTIVYI
jgi:hypothetical protein